MKLSIITTLNKEYNTGNYNFNLSKGIWIWL